MLRDPTTNSQTLQVILQSQSGLDNLKAIYNKNYPMMKDVWLVHVDSNTDLFETFKTYNLDYKTMLFPFTFNSKYLTLKENTSVITSNHHCSKWPLLWYIGFHFADVKTIKY